MLVNAICYKVKKPVIYNEGTIWEKSCDTFLARYGGSKEATEKQIALLNSDESAKAEFCAKQRLIADEIAYFFLNVQEEIDTRGD